MVQFTMWDAMARSFDKECYDSIPKSVMIDVTSCHELQLSATQATYYYLNPNIEEVKQALPEKVPNELAIRRCEEKVFRQGKRKEKKQILYRQIQENVQSLKKLGFQLRISSSLGAFPHKNRDLQN
ncbi:hypothetical protein L1887_28364 [Cichorium endivia]|nr:hypothetical protein L1887_28364 [Cichorium endivia]